jgi:heme exporter protein D
MTTIWNSWDEFFRMGGYGLYVWGSYAATAALLAIEAVQAARRHRRAHAALREGGDAGDRP